jgi:pimeloyl-ACP methyl ester carboxylesterase
LRLALAQPTGNVVYLARPCQFVDTDAPGCAQRYWTEARFAPEVVGATGQAIDVLKRHAGARRLMLVGYSGGGAVAALVAARRDDVERLVTVAGNLDHRTWAAFHHLSPLTESLNPADEVDALRRIPQLHFVGSRDTVIPPRQAVDFAALFPAGQRPMIRVEAGFDHRCCWAEQWKNLWRFVTAQP